MAFLFQVIIVYCKRLLNVILGISTYLAYTLSRSFFMHYYIINKNIYLYISNKPKGQG